MVVGGVAHRPAVIHQPLFDEFPCPSRARNVGSVPERGNGGSVYGVTVDIVGFEGVDVDWIVGHAGNGATEEGLAEAIRTERNALESHGQRHVSICVHPIKTKAKPACGGCDAVLETVKGVKDAEVVPLQIQGTSNDIDIPCLGALDIRSVRLERCARRPARR